ncbi:MAG: glucosamine-6-phosphate deaminase [Planctomycetota bacterium]
MKVIVVKDKKAMGKKGAELIAADMKKKDRPYVLGLATGSTPETMYAEWASMCKKGEVDFSTVITFNLDEYVGLKPTHDQSYRYFMNDKLFNHVNINKKNTFVPDGMAKDTEASCAAYEAKINACGGIDYQVLGIGSNGHIAFNEPGSSLGSRTRKVKLTENTIKDNSRFFKSMSEVPKSAITMGIGTILEAANIILLASGANKVEAVAAAIEGPITASCPASALQTHPNVTFVLTEDAATGLKLMHQS